MNTQEKSYIYGLLGTDGNLYLQDRNRGRITLEVNIKDKDIVEKLYNSIPQSSIKTRTRDTNFKDKYESISFINYQLDFRTELINFGYPTVDKTNTISIPKQDYSERDFWRGVIDGDGSIGITASNEPFISLITKSENLKQYYCKMLFDNFNIVKVISRNKRDDVYNIVVKNENAIKLADFLYKDSFIYLERKYQKYLEVINWERTKKKVSRQMWTEKEIEFIKNHTIKESAIELNRTESSIRNKKYKVMTKHESDK